jgi:hypothetical protein
MYCYRLIFSGEPEKFMEKNWNKENIITEYIFNIQKNNISPKDYGVKRYYSQINILEIWSKSRRFRLLQFLRAFDCTELLEKLYYNLIPIIDVVPSIVLRFLLKKSLLNNLELKAFVITLVLSDKCLIKNTVSFRHFLTQYDKFSSKTSFKLKENPKVNKRSVYLAALFMDGIAEAKFVNDVSGYPMKIFHFQVQQFFDSDVFFSVYNKLFSNENLDLEVCFIIL